MTVISPAIGIQSGSHSAQAFRQMLTALSGQDVETFSNSATKRGEAHGLVRPTHLQVSENGTPNLSVNVSAGTAFITGDSSLAQGPYVFTNDATVNLPIGTADASNERLDLVVAQVRDNTEDGGGSNDARLFVVEGTPAASPSDPTIPAGCLVLARVSVPALDNTITDSQITNLAGTAYGSGWERPWGVLDYAERTSDVTLPATTWTDLTGLSVTATGLTGRLYRISMMLQLQKTSGSGYTQVQLIDDGIPTTFDDWVHYHDSTSTKNSVYFSHLRTFTGSETFEIRCYPSSGGATLQGGSAERNWLLIEDIGPA